MSDFFAQEWSTTKRWSILFGLAIFLTLFCFFQNDLVNEDGVYYIHIAKLLADGKWSEALEYRDFPLVPGLIALVHVFIPNWELSAYFLMMTAMLLAIFPFYGLLQKIQSPKNAWISACFLAVSPSLRFTSVTISRDSVFVLFFVIFLYCIVQIHFTSKLRWYIGSWCALFLVSLCRLEGFLMMGIYAILLFRRMLISPIRWIRFLSIFLFLCCFFWIIIEIFTPYSQLAKIPRFQYITEVFRQPKEFFYNSNYSLIIRNLNQWEKTLPGGDFGGNVLEIVGNYLPLIYLISLFDFMLKSFFPIMLFLGSIGLYHQLRQKSSIDRILFLWFLFLMLPCYLFLLRENFLSKRYLLPCLLIFYCWVGVGFDVFWNWLHEKWNLRLIWQTFILVLFLLIPFIRIIARQEENDNYVKTAAIWLKENAKNSIFITNDCRLLFYTDRPFEFLNYKRTIDVPVIKTEQPKDFFVLANKLKARYLVIWDKNSWNEFGTPIKIFNGKNKKVYIYEYKSQY